MEVTILPIEETSITIEQLYVLIKSAFQERKEAGLNYVCLSMTMPEFLKELESAKPLVAIKETGALCGCTILKLLRNRKGVLYGLEMHTSVSPESKNLGIGSLLIKAIITKAKELGCDYICCSTAVSARSAIRVHLKNGYRIVGMASYKKTNYYSYKFRYSITPSLYDRFIYRKCCFIKSSIKTFLLYKADGSKRYLYYLLKKDNRI